MAMSWIKQGLSVALNPMGWLNEEALERPGSPQPIASVLRLDAQNPAVKHASQDANETTQP